MKKVILLFMVYLLTNSNLFSQDLIDVVHLKNGDILKGIIIENVPSDYIRIELKGGSVMKVLYTNIEKFLKEKKDIEPVTTDFANKALKMSMYESQKKSSTSAIIYSCLLTSAGHAYADNWGRGLLFSAGTIACIVGAVTLGVQEKTSGSSWYQTTTTEITSAFWLFYGAAVIIRIWEVIDASNEVDRYNKKLYDRIIGDDNKLGINLLPYKDGAKLVFSIGL